MIEPVSYSLNIGGRLLSLDTPQVMGILNVTPDSFYAESRVAGEENILNRVNRILQEGGSMVDIGAYSSRPGADEVSTEEEMRRLREALTVIRREHSDIILSVDTFRADVAKMCVEEYGVQIINDISGGMLDPDMFKTAARLGVPYILMHMRGNPKTMQQLTQYNSFVKDVFIYFAEKLQELRDLGQKDIILDPGFGFGKTLEQNYELMQHMNEFKMFDLPVLVGISRKSMIYKLFGTTPQESLNGTTALNTYALTQGAHILRVHDVKQAVEAVQIVDKIRKPYQQ
jgi:dihydropteroate synthase